MCIGSISLSLSLCVCVQVSDGMIDMNYLEQCFPFTLLRQNYIELYEQQTDVSRVAADDEQEAKAL
jgi:hypothetical protein